MKEKSIHFDIQMTFDDETIRRMFRAEYYTYETVQRCLRFFLGGVGILVSFFAPVPTAAKAIFLMFGVWLLVAGDFPSKVQAEGVISKRGGKSSQVRYQLKEEGIQIKGSSFVCYKNLNRLVYDDEYLYLFLNRQNAIMLPIHAVGAERLESVKKEIQEKSKRSFKRLTTGILEYNLKDVLEAVSDFKRNKSNS